MYNQSLEDHEHMHGFTETGTLYALLVCYSQASSAFSIYSQSLYSPADHFWIWHKGLRLTVSIPLAQQCAHVLLPTSVQELAEVMGKANAQTLYQFLHCS